ncbi:hypothetical protein CYOC110262_14420 [Cytobacillus oceanisediminis]
MEGNAGVQLWRKMGWKRFALWAGAIIIALLLFVFITL